MYVFYINGGHVEKRFGREFINFICGGKILQDIKSNHCTRKRCVVSSRYAADKILAANQRAYWPDGSKFKCKLLHRDFSNNQNFDDRDHHYHHHYQRRQQHVRQRRRSDTPMPHKVEIERLVDSDRAPSVVGSDFGENDNWYTSATFIDIDEDDGNDDSSLDKLHDDLQNLTVEI